MSQQERELRVKLIELLNRAESDPTFAEKVKADPMGALTAAGIAQQRAEALIRPDWKCLDTTCWSSECPGTCIVSTIWS